MVQSLIGRKVGMTQVFDDEGRRVPAFGSFDELGFPSRPGVFQAAIIRRRR